MTLLRGYSRYKGFFTEKPTRFLSFFFFLSIKMFILVSHISVNLVLCNQDKSEEFLSFFGVNDLQLLALLLLQKQWQVSLTKELVSTNRANCWLWICQILRANWRNCCCSKQIEANYILSFQMYVNLSVPEINSKSSRSFPLGQTGASWIWGRSSSRFWLH